MTNSLILTFDTTGIRVLEISGDPWFPVKDICSALGISDHRGFAQSLNDKLKSHELGYAPVDSGQGPRDMRIVSESGLYKIAMFSRAEAAERFRNWVAEDVIPTIRRTAGYIHLEMAKKLHGEKSEMYRDMQALREQLRKSKLAVYSSESRYFNQFLRERQQLETRLAAVTGFGDLLEDLTTGRGLFAAHDVVSDVEVAEAYRVSRDDAEASLRKSLGWGNFYGETKSGVRVWAVRGVETFKIAGWEPEDYRGIGCWRAY